MTESLWGIVLIACLTWYSTVTVYVAIRGAFDIKHMLARLSALKAADENDVRS